MASPEKKGYSPDTMACLTHKRKLNSFTPAALVALLVSLEGESENASCLDCKMIEGTPQIVGINNQTAGVNNRTPMCVSPNVQPANEHSTPREFDNRIEGRISAVLTMRMLATLERINAKLDSPLLLPGSYSGSTETLSLEPTSMVLHCVPEGSANIQHPYLATHMPQTSATVQPLPATAWAPVGSASTPQMNPLPLSTGWVHAENETHLPDRSSLHQGQCSCVVTHTFSASRRRSST
ncbi:hypothetical protein H4S08_004877 [Coemansia sp. RSA 1365]|nr:hypothetical protein H4S08_004877 [Coemansia sp. RSA 1365]